jgi:hypothetical protein
VTEAVKVEILSILRVRYPGIAEVEFHHQAGLVGDVEYLG